MWDMSLVGKKVNTYGILGTSDRLECVVDVDCDTSLFLSMMGTVIIFTNLVYQ